MATVSKAQQSSKAKATILNEKPKPQEETEDFDAQVKEFFHPSPKKKPKTSMLR